jgi:hypothetical protein
MSVIVIDFRAAKRRCRGSERHGSFEAALVDGRVRVTFKGPVDFVELTPKQARFFARTLLMLADSGEITP